MNRSQFWNLNRVAASLVCITGMLASTAALAGGKKDRPRVHIKDLELKRDHDGDLRLWGELYGNTYGDRIEVQIAAQVRVRDLCINPGGKIVSNKSSVHSMTIWDYTRIGKVYGKRDFHRALDVDRRLGYKASCPNRNWRSERRVVVERVHIRLLAGYGYGYGYDRDYDCHHQGYDCGGGYRGYDGYDYDFGFGYGYGYDDGWYGYDQHDHGFGYGYGYEGKYDDYGFGDYGYDRDRDYHGDYNYGYGYGCYDYGGYEQGYYDRDYGNVIATAECWFKGHSNRAYCSYY